MGEQNRKSHLQSRRHAARMKQASPKSSPGTKPPLPPLENSRVVVNTQEMGTETVHRSAALPISYQILPGQPLSTCFQSPELPKQEISLAPDSFAVFDSPPILVGICTLCNCYMPFLSHAAHLASVAHMARLLYAMTLSCSLILQEQRDVAAQANLCSPTAQQAWSSILPEQSSNTASSTMTHPLDEGSITSKRNSYDSHIPKSKAQTQKPITVSSQKESQQDSLWNCQGCSNVFNIGSKQAHHCPTRQPLTSTTINPLNKFFRSFPRFSYNYSLSPATSFQQLQAGLKKWHDWDGSNPETWEEYGEFVSERYQAALTREFNLYFGTLDRLECWHALCRAVGVRPPPPTCKACRSVIRGLHVNIVDLIQWARRGETGQVEIFRTVKELSVYSYENDKIYRRQQSGKGVVLDYLLRFISQYRSR